MKCKFCGAKLPEDTTYCPSCCENNTPEALAAKGKIQGKNMKHIAAIAGCAAAVLVLALVFVLVIGKDFGITLGGNPTESTAPTGSVPTGTVPPAGNEGDVTCKGTYLVSDEQSIQSADVVVATLGDATLTNRQLQIYYQLEVLNFLETYSYYLAYLGLDYTQPLDQQPCSMMEGYTWHQYFLAGALESWKHYQAMTLEAQKDQFQLESTYQQRLDGVEQTMTSNAQLSGFETADAFLQAQCGANVNLAAYKNYMELYLNGYLYFDSRCQSIQELTDEELAAYFQEHREELEAQGIQQGSYLVNVRHILIKVEGGVENADGTITFPNETLAAEAYAKAEKILQMYLDSPTEERFGQLAKEYTADGNGDKGGLYTDVYAGQMVKTFNDWCFDEGRQVGDTGIVTTRFGYHIMYFSGRGEEVWLTQTQQAYFAQQQEALVDQIVGQYELTVFYDKIELAKVDLA